MAYQAEGGEEAVRIALSCLSLSFLGARTGMLFIRSASISWLPVAAL